MANMKLEYHLNPPIDKNSSVTDFTNVLSKENISAIPFICDIADAKAIQKGFLDFSTNQIGRAHV